MRMKIKGQRRNIGKIEPLASCLCGPVLVLPSPTGGEATEGPIPSRSTSRMKIPPASGCNRSRGMSSGMSQGQGFELAVILALRPEESKGQNDVPQLPYRMPKIRKDTYGPTEIPLLPVLQDLL